MPLDHHANASRPVMVALPLFKLGSLLLRHVSKYGANYIKRQAHDHPRFRQIAERGGQRMHQLNMRFTVSALRDPAAEQRAREKAEAPTVKTEEQARKEFEETKTSTTTEPKPARPTITSVWKRKFRPLPEAKAVDLFADVVGDGFILSIAVGLIMWEYLRGRGKPDKNDLRITELEERFAEVEKRREELEEREKACEEKLSILEQALEALERPKRKQVGVVT